MTLRAPRLSASGANSSPPTAPPYQAGEPGFSWPRLSPAVPDLPRDDRSHRTDRRIRHDEAAGERAIPHAFGKIEAVAAVDPHEISRWQHTKLVSARWIVVVVVITRIQETLVAEFMLSEFVIVFVGIYFC